MKHLEVVGAVIQYDGKILCMQRGAGKYDYVSYKYEFPGGKVEAGETHPEALMRELREEMNFDVSITEEDYLTTVNHRYPDFEITMYCYLCHVSISFLVSHRLSSGFSCTKIRKIFDKSCCLRQKSLNALKNERITEPSLDHSCRKQTGFSVIRHPPFGVTAVKQIVITHIVKFKLGFMNFYC